jgi:peptide/nickel transport system ATP-binding protein
MSRPDQTPRSSGAADELLCVRGLRKYYSASSDFWDQLLGTDQSVQAVDGVDLAVKQGETVAVVGESGCGKSTLARTIIGLEEHTDGEILFNGSNVTDMTSTEEREMRQEIQMIFQDPVSSLNPRQTVGQILTAPMEVHDLGASKSERIERAKTLLERVGLKPSHVERYPEQFSGGQQQRIGIARALSVDPELLIADEPVSALDVSVQAQILALLQDLQRDFDLGILLITHDLSVVRHIADRVGVMYLGEIVESAPTKSIFESPKHPYTKSLLSAVPRIDPEARRDRILLKGDVPSPISPPPACRFHTRCPSIIPPSDWEGEQDTFRSVFTFRTSVLNGEIRPEEIREILDANDDDIGPERVREYVLENSLDADLSSVPPEYRDVLVDATDRLCQGNGEAAKDLLRTEITSRCAEHDPDVRQMGENSFVSCHLYEDRPS